MGFFARGLSGQGREADHTPPFSAEVKNVWSCTSAPRMACAWKALPLHMSSVSKERSAFLFKVQEVSEDCHSSWTLNMKKLRSFETSGTINRTMQRHIPEDRNPQVNNNNDNNNNKFSLYSNGIFLSRNPGAEHLVCNRIEVRKCFLRIKFALLF